jgi:hypothetical protein
MVIFFQVSQPRLADLLLDLHEIVLFEEWPMHVALPGNKSNQNNKKQKKSAGKVQVWSRSMQSKFVLSEV